MPVRVFSLAAFSLCLDRALSSSSSFPAKLLVFSLHTDSVASGLSHRWSGSGLPPLLRSRSGKIRDLLPFINYLELNLFVSGDEVRRVTDVAFPTSGTRLHGCQRYSVQGCTLGVASLASSSKQVHSFSSHVSSLSRSSMVSAFRTLVLISLVGAGILHRRHPSVSPTPNTVTQRCVSFLLCAPQCCAV